MKCLNIIKSKEDKAFKYIFKLDTNLIVEATFIDKNDGKYIICMPNQTGCKMGCKFCYLSDLKNLKVNNVKEEELNYIVDYILEDLNVVENIKNNNKQLLLSFMGSGEPLCNYKNLLYCVKYCSNKYGNVRGAIATIMNDFKTFNDFSNKIEQLGLDIKVHLSMHYTNDVDRKEWMPNCGELKESIEQLKRYKGKKEIHYTLIKDINDKQEDIQFLIDNFKNNEDITIKFIKFNPKDSSSSIGTKEERIQEIVELMKANMSNPIEVYTPPASDIGGSCGQFLLDYYKEYNLQIVKSVL